MAMHPSRRPGPPLAEGIWRVRQAAGALAALLPLFNQRDI